MSYRLPFNEPLGSACKTIAREELRRIVAALTAAEARPEAVHQGRKSIKRVRALLRMVRPGLGKARVAAVSDPLREAAALMAQQRELAVLLETLDKLESSMPGKAVQSLADVHKHFKARRAELLAPLDKKTVRAVAQLVRQADTALDKLRFADCARAALLDGLGDTYRRGRRQYKAAYAAPEDEAMHDLRKAVQAHWRQMLLLRPLWPDVLRARANEARKISQLLGDDQDLAALIRTLQALREVPPPGLNAVIRLARARQDALRAEAKQLVARLYAEPTRAFTKRIGIYWQAAPKIKDVDPTLPPANVSVRRQAAGQRPARKAGPAQTAPRKRQKARSPRKA